MDRAASLLQARKEPASPAFVFPGAARSPWLTASPPSSNCVTPTSASLSTSFSILTLLSPSYEAPRDYVVPTQVIRTISPSQGPYPHQPSPFAISDIICTGSED